VRQQRVSRRIEPTKGVIDGGSRRRYSGEGMEEFVDPCSLEMADDLGGLLESSDHGGNVGANGPDQAAVLALPGEAVHHVDNVGGDDLVDFESTRQRDGYRLGADG
jgi:hypothetical protein